jgi:hypothetical protein
MHANKESKFFAKTERERETFARINHFDIMMKSEKHVYLTHSPEKNVSQLPDNNRILNINIYLYLISR